MGLSVKGVVMSGYLALRLKKTRRYALSAKAHIGISQKRIKRKQLQYE
jgi:hypothetical protein